MRRQKSEKARQIREKARIERLQRLESLKPFWERYGRDIKQALFFIFSIAFILYLLTPPGGWLRRINRWQTGKRKKSLIRKPKSYLREREDNSNIGYQYRDDKEFVYDDDDD